MNDAVDERVLAPTRFASRRNAVLLAVVLLILPVGLAGGAPHTSNWALVLFAAAYGLIPGLLRCYNNCSVTLTREHLVVDNLIVSIRIPLGEVATVTRGRTCSVALKDGRRVRLLALQVSGAALMAKDRATAADAVIEVIEAAAAASGSRGSANSASAVPRAVQTIVIVVALAAGLMAASLALTT